MKKCPYCAEEIKNEAVVCRYCYKTVKGVMFKRTLRTAIILVLILTVVKNFPAIKKFYGNVAESSGEIREYIRNIFSSMRRAFDMLEENKKFQSKSDIMMEELNKAMGNGMPDHENKE